MIMRSKCPRLGSPPPHRISERGRPCPSLPLICFWKVQDTPARPDTQVPILFHPVSSPGQRRTAPTRAVAAGARQKRQGMAFSVVCSARPVFWTWGDTPLWTLLSHPIDLVSPFPALLGCPWGGGGAVSGPPSALRFPLHLTHLSVPPRRLCAEPRLSRSHSLDALYAFLPRLCPLGAPTDWASGAALLLLWTPRQRTPRWLFRSLYSPYPLHHFFPQIVGPHW